MRNGPKIIITADDYGALMSIDRGITEAIKAKRIHTVSCFANFGAFERSINDLLKLKSSYNFGIGVHLNLTAGQPILKNKVTLKYLTDSKGYFRPLNELITHVDQIPSEVIYSELKQQLERVRTSVREIDHLSHHMNVLNLHPRLFVIQTKLAEEFNLSVRNPYPMSMNPKYSQALSPSLKKVVAKFITAIPQLAKRPRSIKQIIKMTKPSALEEKIQNKGIKTTSLFCDLFYGAVNISTLQKQLNKIDVNKSVEIMTHPGHFLLTELIPNGIDARYMPNRAKELSTILSEAFKIQILNEYPQIPNFQSI